MKRRQFLTTASASLLPIALNGFSLRSVSKNSGLIQSILKTNAIADDKVLVIIYLNGGNDGLNTVIPIEHYSNYYSLRSNIAIPESNVLRLQGNLETGLHPAMTGMRKMYDEGKLAIVHSVSYPNPNQSHNRSADIYMTGVESNQFATSGWAGRFLEKNYPGYPQGYPNSNMEDPLALQIGYVATTTLLGSQQSTAINIKTPGNFYQIVGSPTQQSSDLPCCDPGDLIAYVREQQLLSVGYASEIKAASDAGTNLAAYPPAAEANDLAEQLKIVAKLIHGGLRTKVYYVELEGFDTHSGQVGTTSVEGTHAKLLKKLSDAVAAFQNDLKLQGTENKVIGLTFSDFGRRATSNASKGTDHGIAAPMFVFGTGIKRQIIGTNPDLVNGLLPELPGPSEINRDIKMQIDFRRVYSDILNDWFGNASSSTEQVLYRNFNTTSLFSDLVQSISSGSWINPSTWSNGRVPAAADAIRINRGHIVEVGHNIIAKKINVEGELKFLGNYSVKTTS
ncbi:DUF1501 domain-containing protein [Dyadobacter chenhuakuii]|uniref:DUF1501 domain-containing protein n=1 Tax=Dyadobacter chenhuakuii TaxID=2909339 RepID=A0A9X1TVQ3_9BACT|nr:DUF1501 domain-containing protein [Dyadobacter chenhuakuii]MCF2501520.1 DUF1501 domain-containing protein [Dyadobacter chenhuakuii]